MAYAVHTYDETVTLLTTLRTAGRTDMKLDMKLILASRLVSGGNREFLPIIACQLHSEVPLCSGQSVRGCSASAWGIWCVKFDEMCNASFDFKTSGEMTNVSQLRCPHQCQISLCQCCLVMSVPMHVINLQLTITEMLQIQRMWASYQEACDTV